MSVSVRAASAEDARDLAELSAAAFRNTYEPVLETATIDDVVAQSCTSEAFQRLVQHNAAGVGLSGLLVAVDGAELVGFLDFAEEDDGLELRRLWTLFPEAKNVTLWPSMFLPCSKDEMCP